MVHRPGLEHSRLTPSNAEELLFDDVMWVARAKAEHDMFAEVMRDRGVEVFEAEQLLAEALARAEAREWVCGHILSERQWGSPPRGGPGSGSRARSRRRWRSF
jgi:arginine deiminase